jgi:hypothetical protein
VLELLEGDELAALPIDELRETKAGIPPCRKQSLNISVHPRSSAVSNGMQGIPGAPPP